MRSIYMDIKKKIIVFIVLFVVCIIGCESSNESISQNDLQSELPRISNATEPDDNLDEFVIYVDDRGYTVEDINAGIKNAFNEQLYYHGEYDSDYILTNKDIIQGKNVEYDLYLCKSAEYTSPYATIYIRNIEHYQSTPENPLFYSMSIFLTKYGMPSDFNSCGPIKKDAVCDESDYLGKYSMRIDEIIRPNYEEIGEALEKNVKSAVQLYMDRNDFMGEEKTFSEGPEVQTSFKTGAYNVYVKKFSEADTDSTVIFEHEDGSIYEAKYCFVHDAIETKEANLRYIFYYSAINETDGHKSFVDKVKKDPVLCFKYVVNQG